jgi:XTP/dITP diphosphohydrolase
MKKQIIFASNNKNKAEEIRSILGNDFNIITLKESGIEVDIPEPFFTLEENAAHKAKTIHNLRGENCFSEDSGLEIEALKGRPGVHSAHYAGIEADSNKNMEKVLNEMLEIDNRKATFKTVLFLILNDQEYQFEGTCTGKINREKKGEQGFGYDPIFIPDGDTKTFAEMTMTEKNKYSHRKKAMTHMIEFLKQSRT